MITASHNPAADNGVKIVDPMGQMLEASWEAYATQLANTPSEQLSELLALWLREWSLSSDVTRDACCVLVGRDTRPSGQRLVDAASRALEAVSGRFLDVGCLTTPQLHYLVRCLNTAQAYGLPSELGYFSKLASAYRSLVSSSTAVPVLYVDCANGVGALKMAPLQEALGWDRLQLRAFNVNVADAAELNHQCGADFVKVEQKLPVGVPAGLASGTRLCSLDGDADRIVYFYQDPGCDMRLLDGDYIAALAADYLQTLLDLVPGLHLGMGVVQTAYANGGSTRFFSQRKIQTLFAETGVKNLHHRAEEFEIGLYFEANGHGTVLFQQAALNKLDAFPRTGLNDSALEALASLRSFADLINQTVGDAISDLLMVEAILSRQSMSIADWAHKFYQPLPNRQLKVKVKDRSQFRTTDADRILTEPSHLQPEIDALVHIVELGRAFVRPSGTEDVVRVYAEAKSRSDCDQLAYRIAHLVFTEAGGVGDAPRAPNAS